MTYQPGDVPSNASYTWLTGYNRIVPHLHEESDRSAAILGASFLEAALRTRFMDVFIDDPSTRKLFDAYRPLSTFAAVIDVGFLPWTSHAGYEGRPGRHSQDSQSFRPSSRALHIRHASSRRLVSDADHGEGHPKPGRFALARHGRSRPIHHGPGIFADLL